MTTTLTSGSTLVPYYVSVHAEVQDPMGYTNGTIPPSYRQINVPVTQTVHFDLPVLRVLTVQLLPAE